MNPPVSTTRRRHHAPRLRFAVSVTSGPVLVVTEASSNQHKSMRELIKLVQPKRRLSLVFPAWQYLIDPAGEARFWVLLSGSYGDGLCGA